MVEAGVTFVTVDCPHWDDHSSIEKGHGYKVRPLDQAVGALIDDLVERGLFGEVLIVIMGELAARPKSTPASPASPFRAAITGATPSRPCWPAAASRAARSSAPPTPAPNIRPHGRLKPADLLATVYHVLGIDPKEAFKDFTGRPVPILDEGQAIEEVI